MQRQRFITQFVQPFCVRSAHASRCARVGWCAVLSATTIACGGCRMLSRRGPIPESVATCRQFSSQGRTAMERGDWARAETLLGRAVSAYPADPEARRAYAEALVHRGAAAAAVAQLEEARTSAPDDPTLTVRAGELYLSLGKRDEAFTAAQQALDADAKSPQAWLLLGQVMEANGDVRQALAHYQRALGYAPSNAAAQLRIAEAHRRLGKPERALASLQSLLEMYPPGEEPAQAFYLQGLAQTALTRYDDASASFRAALQRGPASAEVWCRLAEAEMLAGNSSLAQAATDRGLALDPTYPLGRDLQSRLLTAQAAPDRQRR